MIQSTAAIRFKIARRPEIGVDEFHSPFAQRVDVQMAAGAAEIIEPGDLDRRIMVEQAVGDAAPGETADPGEEDFHFGVALTCSPA